jgi:hypothetical protein
MLKTRERLDHARIELATGLADHFGDGVLYGPRFLIRALMGQRIKHVGDGHDPSL